MKNLKLLAKTFGAHASPGKLVIDNYCKCFIRKVFAATTVSKEVYIVGGIHSKRIIESFSLIRNSRERYAS